MLNVISGVHGAPTPPVTNSYQSISTVTVGAGGSSSITFSSIPSTYKHLQIRYIAKGTSTSGGYPTGSDLSLNSDTTNSNYFGHYLRGDGSSATAGSGISARNSVIFVPGSSGSWSSSSTFGTGIVEILDYTNTSKYKTIRALSGADANGAGAVSLNSMTWANTSAVTSITITADPTYTTNFAQYSSFALYGIKG